MIQLGVNNIKYESMVGDIENKGEEEINVLHNNFNYIINNEYKSYLAIWTLQTEEIWNRYELFGQQKLLEYRMLKESKKNLLNCFYDLFPLVKIKKNKNQKQEPNNDIIE